jgi:hypothetical protein
MRREKNLPKGRPAKSSRPVEQTGSVRSAEERRVWAILEKARENVRSVAKRELEGEVISGEVLNFRLRS